MDAIYIPHLLKAPDRTRIIVLDDMIPDLETLTPVRGKLLVRHGGNFLDLSLKAETIITLTCDRCLRKFNHRLALNTSEIIWLEENGQEKTYPAEREIAWEDLSETLPVDGHFAPELWLYEQLSLALPLRQLCGENCQAPSLKEPETPNFLDSRWSSLEGLKKNL
jgi:uncharacterized protein